ncbi:MAG TPA: LCP family protein [Candidatus Limnocylindrales bacterium]|jgi:LCP family protein required for cell wall assembly
MQPGQEDRPPARSAFVAAFLSLLFPGLGHAYAGAYTRALGFAAGPILIGALVAGIVLRLPRPELVGLALQSWFLTSVFVLNLLLLGYRLIAIIDAWRVTSYLNAWTASGGGRLGTPRIPLSPISVAGLLAVVLVMAGGHVAVARYDLIAMRTADCIFDADRTDCDEGSQPSGSPSGSASDEPPVSPSEATSSLPSEGTALPNVTPPPWNGTDRLNVVLIGSDEQNGGHNTDTLITVSIDPVSKQVAMFSLPRDMVDVPLPSGPARNVFGRVYRGKINSLWANARGRADAFPGTSRTRGYNAIKAALGELYGLDIKYFVEVNFDGFIRVVDALGGVAINVQIPVVDNTFPGVDGLRRVYIPSGYQHMDGAQALMYARSRHTSNDFDRAQRQQRVLLSLREQANIGAILPHVDELAAALRSAVRTDIPRNLLPQLLGLAESVDTRNIRSYVFSPPLYGQDSCRDPRGCVEYPRVDEIRNAVRTAFTANPAEEQRREALASEGARVWVLNGSGDRGQAADIAAYLNYVGIAASAPNQRPDQAGGARTRILVYNGAEQRLPVTIAALSQAFGVQPTLTNDPTARVDIAIITASSTPTLSPPPAP